MNVGLLKPHPGASRQVKQWHPWMAVLGLALINCRIKRQVKEVRYQATVDQAVTWSAEECGVPVWRSKFEVVFLRWPTIILWRWWPFAASWLAVGAVLGRWTSGACICLAASERDVIHAHLKRGALGAILFVLAIVECAAYRKLAAFGDVLSQ